ncbi:MAG: post-segregation antitoxin CcdA [Burkholderiales bacterium PBB3]|nr:MAG: post-segregation antitoxin CcdA [Burkholderiales bacterium PBB3]
MLTFDNAPKKATNLSLSASTLEKARELGLNLSKTVDELLEKEVRRVSRIQWAERNKVAIEQYNARIESEGTFAQQVQEWLVAQGETPAPNDAPHNAHSAA